jgi:monovalent cation:H+ antiporter-2, CPA2 family
MHEFNLLEILAIGFLLALFFGFITHKLKLSPIVGYLIAGYIIGPHSPGFIADPALASQLAEVGVILLMFGVGLHFNLTDLLAVKRIAIPGAIAQSLVAAILGMAVAVMAGFSPISGFVLGVGVAVASTVVLMRVLLDNDMIDTFHGHAAVGWLIVEDILTVLVLVLLPAIAAISGHSVSTAGDLLSSLLLALGKIAFLLLLILFIGGKVAPWIMAYLARTRSNELFTLAVLALAFAIAIGSARIFGASIALGAFLAGMVVGKTKVSHQAASDILPMRDAFAVLFFISVGMIIDPIFIVQRPWLVLACLGIILIAKPLIASATSFILGYSIRTSLTVAIGLAQIGEFSFILAQQALNLKMIELETYNLLAACALISISLNPFLFGKIDKLESWLRKRERLWQFLSRRSNRIGNESNLLIKERLGEITQPKAIVVGYGPVGQSVASALRNNDIQPVIIDLNIDTVNSIVANGQLAIYGDATRQELLKNAGIEKARYLLITLPDFSSAIAIVTSALNLVPDITIIVRSRYLESRTMLEKLGVTAISFEEKEVAKAMEKALMESVKK